ncbi:DeoR family glycerol-3-phosphate regulon repressor [Roseibium hamelinense]|uniref:DeoR family glycerol-3-phosphate regulon repressor n=1 Tax=Roseibium hamelinense TaxID=150831 RepID=A0A562T8D0_9HYPH|nr:DeoR family glycerol-3-phosphate regulon repressor [Roseibium hamelinense]
MRMDRKGRILEIAQRDGRVAVEQLAGDLSVSAHTIRRDINALCQEAKLRRLHGGAEFIESSRNVAYEARAVLNYEAKKAINLPRVLNLKAARAVSQSFCGRPAG